MPVVKHLKILAPQHPAQSLLTEGALSFIASLSEVFGPRLQVCLQHRLEVQERINQGQKPDFLKETKEIRESKWQIGSIPPALQDRRVEITGPVDRKMVINALNSGAKVFMADFEDAHAPLFENTLQGQQNLYDAVRKIIQFESSEGKHYQLAENPALLLVRPRGLHLKEAHLRLHDKAIEGALFDFGLFAYLNAKHLCEQGMGPYFYIPKLEHYLEARWWREVITFTEDALGLKRGTIKVTVLIETILAAFQMEEILFELRDHIVGLNCGRWDYIFSFIKKFHAYPEWVLPDRASVTMEVPFLKAYSELLIHTCHKRGAYAMGGMSAHIPVRGNPEAHAQALAKVRADKEREAKAGHDGTWVAHPALVPVAMEIFNHYMPGPNQLHRLYPDKTITAADLLALPQGAITEAGIKNNIAVSLRYIESWIRGVGCVPIFNLMEDAATAEISRSQLWQWIHSPKAFLIDGSHLNYAHFYHLLEEELQELEHQLGQEAWKQSRFKEAATILSQLVKEDTFEEFLTLKAMAYLKTN